MKKLAIFTLLLTLSMGATIAQALERPTPAQHGEIDILQFGVVHSPVDVDRGILTDLFQDGGDRLVALQNNDGGWDWELDDGDPNSTSPLNTIGPIAKGLARAWAHTADSAQLASLLDAGGLLLTKTNNFSPSDGYLAAQLDEVFGGGAYTAHVMANFYTPLANGTYDRNGAGTLYTTAAYVQLIRDARASGGIGNLAAWDIGMGLVGALSAGADGADWIAGVKAEIDELDGAAYYDVIGLAGAVYGLAFAGEDFDPTAGEHAGASNLSDLADILVTYQIDGGGFAWNSDYVIPDDGNETIQETAYACLALDEVDRDGYLANITGAASYMLTVQLPTGGWDNYPGSGENNEITGEALWGIDESSSEITEVWVDASYDATTPGWGITHFDNIQDAIDAVTGSTVNIAAGTYVTSGQVVLSMDITLQGTAGNEPVIMTDSNTGSSGDARGWWLVQPGVTVTLRNLILDGSGYNVYQGIRALGDGTLEGCTLRHMTFPGYGGTAFVAMPGTNWAVTGNTLFDIGRIGIFFFGAGTTGSITDNDYTGKGAGDWIDYGIELGGGAVVSTISGNFITGCTGVASSDGSTSAGVLIDTYFGPGTEGHLTGNIITGNSTGIFAGYDAADTAIVTATGNILSGNASAGVEDTGGPATVAYGNWWGDATGPYNAATNPGGLGVPVSDNVLFDPWLLGNVICVPDPEIINLADGPGFSEQIVVEYLGGGSDTVYGYSIEVTWDPLVVSANPGSFAKPDNGVFASAQLFLVAPIPGGVRVDAAIGGASGGTMADELFKATFTAVGTPDYATSVIDLNPVAFRNNLNQPLTGFVEDDGLIIVDLVGPSVTGVSIVNNTLAHTNDFIKDTDAATVTATVSDGGGLTAGDISADLSGLGGGASVTPDSYVANVATWAVAGAACTPADGTVTVLVTAVDAGANSASSSDDITSDNTLPVAVSGFDAAPAHNEIDCVWDDASGNDANYYRVDIQQAAWGDYPNYATPAPAFPGSGGAPIFSGLGTATTLAYLGDGSERDIVYLQAFVVDIVLHFSAADTGARDRATNYWLGDVSDGAYGQYDGYVAIADITALGSSYGLFQADMGFKDETDVGPTDTLLPKGIPMPDDYVGFEDLMMFALHYGEVAPLPVFQNGATAAAAIAWRQTGENTWTLSLENPCIDLQGLRLSSDMAAGSVIDVQPGALCDAQSQMVFIQNVDRNGLDVGLALLGQGAIIVGEGVLFSVTFADGVSPHGLELQLRSSSNQPVEADSEITATGGAAPTVYRLAQNHPNPFNPKTSISFDLPDAQSVKLVVFAPDGRRIVTLVNDTLNAGTHVVSWNGRDENGATVASGVYFYRIDAGPLHQTNKMLMLK